MSRWSTRGVEEGSGPASRWYVVFGAIALLVALVTGIGRIQFKANAQRTEGEVVAVVATNTRCGHRSTAANTHRYDCTKFKARVAYQDGGQARETSVSAGEARGYDQPASRAELVVGSRVPVLFRSGTNEVYRDDGGMWGLPLVSLALGLVLLGTAYWKRG